MDLQKRRKLIEEGVIVDVGPKSPGTEDTRLVSKEAMMVGLLAKDYGTTIQNEKTLKFPDEMEKSDAGEKENLDKDTLENNAGRTGDNAEIVKDNLAMTGDNIVITIGDNMRMTEDDVGLSRDKMEITENYTKMNVDNRGEHGGGNEGEVNLSVDYCELDGEDGEETELYNKGNITKKEIDKKKIGI